MGILIGSCWKVLIFLSGCSAVNNGRDVMGFDDVICATETYFKFLNIINEN
jgi:hypothetical protein